MAIKVMAETRDSDSDADLIRLLDISQLPRQLPLTQSKF